MSLEVCNFLVFLLLSFPLIWELFHSSSNKHLKLKRESLGWLYTHFFSCFTPVWTGVQISWLFFLFFCPTKNADEVLYCMFLIPLPLRPHTLNNVTFYNQLNLINIFWLSSFLENLLRFINFILQIGKKVIRRLPFQDFLL